MTASSRPYPDHAWFDGQIASWENKEQWHGHLWLFEVIGDPQNFKEIFNSAGDTEIIELYEPRDGQTMTITFIDAQNQPLGQPPFVLDQDNLVAVIPQGARFEMDARGTTTAGDLAYTCIALGLHELPE